MNNHRNRGFSLIELLISMAIVSVVMIIVTQFMGTTSGALRKTKKNLAIQTEALDVGNQLSDALVSATYIRVRTKDKKTYILDTQLSGKRRKRTNTVKASPALSGDLVVDNYPNYIRTTGAERKIILGNNYRLVTASGTSYPLATDTSEASGTVAQSFRLLTENGTADPAYVIPQYIYVRYQRKLEGTEKEAYVIFYFSGTNVYMARGDYDSLTGAKADGFQAAINAVNTKASGALGTNGLLTQYAEDYYFSADTLANTVFLSMKFRNPKYKAYYYDYEETVILRNTNVLTVPPQKMFKKG